MYKYILTALLLTIFNFSLFSQDTIPPDITSLSITPQIVDVTNGAVNVTIKLGATDNLSGVRQISTAIMLPNGFNNSKGSYFESGTSTDGIWKTEYNIPKYSKSGIAKVVLVSVLDSAYNQITYHYNDLLALGFNPDFEIINNNQDSITPQISTLTITPQIVDVTNGAANVTIKLGATDNLSGVRQISTAIMLPNGINNSKGSYFESGTSTDGIWKTEYNIPKYSKSGIAKVVLVSVLDSAYNQITYHYNDLLALGFNPDFEIINNNSIDSISPQISSMQITPQIVNVTNGDVFVSGSLGITDNFSGVSSANATIKLSNGKSYQHSLYINSGNSNNGNWIFNFFVPKYFIPGIGKIDNIIIADSVGNIINLSYIDLINAGFDPDFEIINNGQIDTLPPQILTFNLTPQILDVSYSAENEILTLNVTDDISGIKSIYVSCKLPNGNIIYEYGYLRSGTNLDGTWKVYFYIPKLTQSGNANIESITIIDFVNNEKIYSYNDLINLGFDPDFEIINNSPPDNSPPQLVSLDISPQIIDITNGSQNGIINLEVTDSLSGLIDLYGEIILPNNDHLIINFILISGTNKNGIWQYTLTVPQFSFSGISKIGFIYLRDKAGNEITLSYNDLVNLGFDADFEIINNHPADITPPLLQYLHISPQMVDITNGPAEVSFNLNITDDISGVDTANILILLPIGQYCVPEIKLISGNRMNGIWNFKCTIPQYTKSGLAKIYNLSIWDKTENNIIYNYVDLVNLGFDSMFVIINNNISDTIPPQLTSFNISPQIVDVSNSSAEVTVNIGTSDDLSGVEKVIFPYIMHSNGYINDLEANIISGNNINGIWQLKFLIPQYLKPGIGNFPLMLLYDKAGNIHSYNGSDIVNLGYDNDFEIINTNQVDTILPQLLSFDISPQVVDITNGNVNVSFTIGASDNLSGIKKVTPTFILIHGNEIKENAELISGTFNNGVWQLNYSIPQYSRTGIVHINYLRIEDSVGNVFYAYYDDLINMGFDPDFEIIVNPCTDKPNAGIITSQSNYNCSDLHSTLCLSGNSNGIGMNYQWFISDNINGPFNPLTDPLNKICYTTDILLPGSYFYKCIVTCYNSGLSDTTDVFTLTIIPSVTISSIVNQPSACNINDGTITLILEGAVGPYSFNWSTPNGNGLVNGVQNQTGLSVGSYFVTVTAGNGCTSTAVFSLSGPGGCSICPTIPTMTSTSTNSCIQENFTLTQRKVEDCPYREKE